MQTLFRSLTPEWFQFKSTVDAHLVASLKNLKGPLKLQEACQYAVLEGGKRFRPIITLLTAKAAGCAQLPLDAAAAVEFFHSASLVADDLPCMDNDEWRRGRLTVHKKFGTATALMATFSLISEGFAALTRACRSFHVLQGKSCERTLLAFESASHCTGMCGVTGGQYSDLFTREQLSEHIQGILQQKTGSLFDMAFAFGWLFGDGSLAQLPKVQDLGMAFGTAFQICDDCDDFASQQDQPQALNSVALLGKKRALGQLSELLQKCKSIALELSIHRGGLENMFLAFDAYVRETYELNSN